MKADKLVVMESRPLLNRYFFLTRNCHFLMWWVDELQTMSQSYTTKTYLKKQELHLTIMKHTAKYKWFHIFYQLFTNLSTCKRSLQSHKIPWLGSSLWESFQRYQERSQRRKWEGRWIWDWVIWYWTDF